MIHGSLFDHKDCETKKNYYFIQEISILWLTFNPGLALTDFWTTRHWLAQLPGRILLSVHTCMKISYGWTHEVEIYTCISQKLCHFGCCAAKAKPFCPNTLSHQTKISVTGPAQLLKLTNRVSTYFIFFSFLRLYLQFYLQFYHEEYSIICSWP